MESQHLEVFDGFVCVFLVKFFETRDCFHDISPAGKRSELESSCTPPTMFIFNQIEEKQQSQTAKTLQLSSLKLTVRP